MPLLTLHLLRLRDTVDVEQFLGKLHAADSLLDIVVAARPHYIVVKPTKQDVQLLGSLNYNLMLLLKTSDGFSWGQFSTDIEKEYKLFVGIPSKITATYKDYNQTLLRDAPRAPLTGALDNPKIPQSSQNLELSPDLLRFMDGMRSAGPVTMLNLLNFHDDGKDSYYQYGQSFKKVAGRRGGDAKIVGNVVNSPKTTSSSHETVVGGADKWQEVAIVHYPSIVHFCDMLGGEDYQEINDRWRLPALADTLLLCTTEIDLTKLKQKAKL